MPRYKFCSSVLIKKSMELMKAYFGEEMQNAAPLQKQEAGKEHEEIPEQMLGFLEQLGSI